MSINTFFRKLKTIPDCPDISDQNFSKIIDLPGKVPVQDLSSIKQPETAKSKYSIGRYNEKRPNMYKGDLFEQTGRYIHMGIDIGAPIGTPIKSFDKGEIFMYKNNNRVLDYGYTIITRHTINNQDFFALYGHLSENSIKDKYVGKSINAGDVIGYIGSEKENGGWPPHIHFQLSLIQPKECDLPGVVSDKNHDLALKVFPDPRIVLGQLY